MKQNYQNAGLRVRLDGHTSLDMLLITVMAAMPFLPYVLSAGILIVVGMSILVIKQTRDALRAQIKMYSVVLAISVVSVAGALIYKNIIGLWIAYGVFLVLTFGTYASAVMNKILFERVITVSALGSLVQLCAVLVQRIRDANPDYRPEGFSYSPNYLGAVAVLAAMLSLIALLENNSMANFKKNYSKNIIYIASLLANGAILLICESRSSLLGLMAGVFLLLLLKKHYVMCTVATLGGMGIWLLGYFYPELFGWANSLVFVFGQRYVIWVCALAHFAQNPLTVLIGRGPMSYRFLWENGLADDTNWYNTEWLAKQKYLGIPEEQLEQYANDIKNANHAHNIFADTLVNVGVIGALFYVLLLHTFLKNAFKKLRLGDKTAFMTVIVAFAVILVQGIPDVTIMWHQTATLFVLMCAASYKREG